MRICGYALSLPVFLAAIFPVNVLAQQTANSNSVYQQLRGLMPNGDIITVNNLEVRRDAAVFTFQNGDFIFYGPVNGKVTGAVFFGQGHLHITPPTQVERHNLSIHSQSQEFDEDFNSAVFRFTDNTAEELRQRASGKGGATLDAGRDATDLQLLLRRHLKQNLDLRLLQDVLSPAPGGFFFAAIHGSKNPHLFLTVDPQGVAGIAPEEIELLNWNEWGITIPLAFRRAAEYKDGTANGNQDNAAYRITNENLDVSIEKDGFLSSVATVEIRAQQDAVAVVPFNLYPTLRVSKVETDTGGTLDFVQEKKEEDADFGVVLAQPLKKGETVTVRITYGGKNVVLNKGGGNYYPIARENWFPSNSHGLGDSVSYQMRFHVPKGLQVIATGNKIKESTDGKLTTTEWKTDLPLFMAGFSLGDFQSKEFKFDSSPNGTLTVDAYANKDVPDSLRGAQGGVLGSLETTPMLAAELSQGAAAAQIYTSYFGPLPFSHLSLTQQSACDYGQSWPMLVYLPICGFFDSTQQHFMGIGGENLNMHMYWKVVTPHEVAHQWWGQTVGFRSYRDQWMSEGFADASASIFLQATRPKPDEFISFWKEERNLLTSKNQYGFRPIDVGPVTMGFRLSSPNAGWNIYEDLVYPKGAYILHMIRMMMWSSKEGDDRFKATMHDFAATYSLQTATTEDFKAVVEKHMSPQMDLDGNHRMDWFFSQYVYGTELPAYHFESQLTTRDDGATLHFKLTQSGVSPNFKMLVPIYLEFTDGKVLQLGSAVIKGSSDLEQTVQLPKLPVSVKKVSINHFNDVLCIDN